MVTAIERFSHFKGSGARARDRGGGVGGVVPVEEGGGNPRRLRAAGVSPAPGREGDPFPGNWGSTRSKNLCNLKGFRPSSL
jgi:hypothetical protein